MIIKIHFGSELPILSKFKKFGREFTFVSFGGTISVTIVTDEISIKYTQHIKYDLPNTKNELVIFSGTNITCLEMKSAAFTKDEIEYVYDQFASNQEIEGVVAKKVLFIAKLLHENASSFTTSNPDNWPSIVAAFDQKVN